MNLNYRGRFLKGCRALRVNLLSQIWEESLNEKSSADLNGFSLGIVVGFLYGLWL
jgi:hypothetical protein